MCRTLSLLAVLTAVHAAAAQPANDAVAAATPIGEPGTVTGSNVGATLEPGEGVPSCQTEQDASVWWTYTPPSDGLVSVDLGGSDFDTVLSLYQPAAAETACNDDVGFPTVTSRVADVPVSGGEPVYIRVAGYRDPQGAVSQGAITLTVSFVDGALVTTTLPPGNTTGRPTFAHPATLGTGESGSCRLSMAGTDVPYEARPFTVTTAGAYTLTIGDAGTAGYDSFILLYRDPFVPSDPCLNLLAFDDDGTAAPDDAQIAGVALAAGGSYTLVVTGFNNLDVGAWTGTIVGPAAVELAPVAGEPAAPTAQAELVATPNPTDGPLHVRLRVGHTQDVAVEVYDVGGRRVALMFHGAIAADRPLDLRLDASRLAAGVYTVRATGAEMDLVQRVTVVR